MPKHISTTLVAAALAAACSGTGDLAAQAKTYDLMRDEVGRYYDAGQFDEAAQTLEEMLLLFPEHLDANCYNLALVSMRRGLVGRALDVLEYAIEHEVWFGKYAFTDDVWMPLLQMPGWVEFHRRNEETRAREQELVEPRLEVRLPAGYNAARAYPLFLAFHGGGENVDVFLPHWRSPLLDREFIVAYPQSTRLISKDGYNWTEDVDLSLREIRDAYDDVVARYPVDTGQVFVGGFSSGGVVALEVVLRNSLTVKGFVVLCPAKPDDFTPSAVRAAAARGVRGTLMTTERDNRVDQQREMARVFAEEGLDHEFFVFPNIGHWYPEDFAERLDRAITLITAGETERIDRDRGDQGS